MKDADSAGFDAVERPHPRRRGVDPRLPRRGLLNGILDTVSSAVSPVVKGLHAALGDALDGDGVTPSPSSATTDSLPTSNSVPPASSPVTVADSVSPPNSTVPTSPSTSTSGSGSGIRMGSGGGDSVSPCSSYGAKCETLAKQSCQGAWSWDCSYPTAPAGLPSGACGYCYCNSKPLLGYASCNSLDDLLSGGVNATASGSPTAVTKLDNPTAPASTNNINPATTLDSTAASHLPVGSVVGVVFSCLALATVIIGAVVYRRNTRTGSKTTRSDDAGEGGGSVMISASPKLEDAEDAIPSLRRLPKDAQFSPPPVPLFDKLELDIGDPIAISSSKLSLRSERTPSPPPAASVSPDDPFQDGSHLAAPSVYSMSSSLSMSPLPEEPASVPDHSQVEYTVEQHWQWLHWQYARQWHEWQLQQRQWQDQQRAYYLAKEEERKQKLKETSGKPEVNESLMAPRRPRVYKPSPLSKAIRASMISTVSRSSSTRSMSTVSSRQGSFVASVIGAHPESPQLNSSYSNRRLSWESFASVAFGTSNAGANADGPKRQNSFSSTGSRESLRRSSQPRNSTAAVGEWGVTLVATTPRWTAPADIVGPLTRSDSSSSTTSTTLPHRSPSILSTDGGGETRTTSTLVRHVIPGYEDQPAAAIVSFTSVGADGSLVTTQTVTLPTVVGGGSGGFEPVAGGGGGGGRYCASPDPRFSILAASVVASDLLDDSASAGGDPFVDPPPRAARMSGASSGRVPSPVVGASDSLESDDPAAAAEELQVQLQYPVRQGYLRSGRSDELEVAVGDHVVLWQVMDDGWCEGYSVELRMSGRFPLSCLMEPN
ncbi:hypothetical protein DFJ73DRAFT_69093 [Zopfochytrium polystomum]|nr:hypothetical protein DFJ73DRAFT_69093 [Zopfochytrium polystomum]